MGSTVFVGIGVFSDRQNWLILEKGIFLRGGCR